MNGEAAAAVADAQAAAARLDATSPGGGLTALSGVLLRSEAVASSRIERLDASFRDVAAAMVGARSAKSDAGRVAANVEAMQLAMRAASSDAQFSVDSFLAVHRRLMRDDPFEGRDAGLVRTEQNWIGGSDYSPRDAMFVPPAPERVVTLLEDLAAFANRTDAPAIAQAAIAHAQFETIHPFGDGNGRTGRVLIHQILLRREVATMSVVPVSTVLLTNPDRYFNGLRSYREGDIDAWVTDFAVATIRAANEGREVVNQLREVAAEWREAVHPRSGSGVDKLLEIVANQPVVTVEHLRDAMGESSEAAIYRSLNRLEAAGVLTETTGFGRNRVWVASDILDVLDMFERAVGRREPPATLT